MTVIRLKAFGVLAAVREVRHTVGEGLKIEMEAPVCGILRLGELRARMVDGTALVEASRLPDGDFLPVLVTDGGEIALPKLSVAGGEAQLVAVSVDDFHRLMLRTCELGARVSELEAYVRRIDGQINRKITF